MCVVSAVGDYWKYNDYPRWDHYVAPINTLPGHFPVPEITKADLDALKQEMEELRKLLVAAKRYDEATGQKDCETEDKVALIRKLAKLAGVNMSEVFGG